MMNYQAILNKTEKSIARRIRDEHRKYSEILPDDWAEITALKIYDSHIHKLVEALEKIVDTYHNRSTNDLFQEIEQAEQTWRNLKKL